MGNDDAEWMKVQKNTFTRWANKHLKKSVEDPEEKKVKRLFDVCSYLYTARWSDFNSK